MDVIKQLTPAAKELDFADETLKDTINKVECKCHLRIMESFRILQRNFDNLEEKLLVSDSFGHRAEGNEILKYTTTGKKSDCYDHPGTNRLLSHMRRTMTATGLIDRHITKLFGSSARSSSVRINTAIEGAIACRAELQENLNMLKEFLDCTFKSKLRDSDLSGCSNFEDKSEDEDKIPEETGETRILCEKWQENLPVSKSCDHEAVEDVLEGSEAIDYAGLIAEILSDDESDAPGPNELVSCDVAEAEVPVKHTHAAFHPSDVAIRDQAGLSAAFGESIEQIWNLVDDTPKGQSEVPRELYPSVGGGSRLWNSQVFLDVPYQHRQFLRDHDMLLEFQNDPLAYLKEVSDVPSDVKSSGIMDTTEPVYRTPNETLELGDFLDSEEPEAESGEGKHENACLEGLTRFAELWTTTADDTPLHDSENPLVAALKDLIEFCEILESSSEDPSADCYTPETLRDSSPEADLPEEDIDSNHNSEGTRLPAQPSEFSNYLESADHFFHGFTSGYLNRNRRHAAPQKSRDETPCLSALTVPCSNWCDLDSESHAVACRLHLGKALNSCQSRNRSPERKNSWESKTPPWVQEEPSTTYSTVAKGQLSSDPALNEKLHKTFFRRAHVPDKAATTTPVEKFLNSLYLSEDILPSEIPAVVYGTKKRRTSVVSVDSGYTSLGSEATSISLDDLFSWSSLESLPSHSDKDECFEGADKVSNSDDIWGDKGQEIYWKPLPVLPKADTSREHHSSSFDLRSARKHKSHSVRSWNDRYVPITRSWPKISSI